MTEPIVKIDRLSKTFEGMKNPALDDITAQILPGHMTGIVGPDGAGKTTLIRLLIGLLHPSSGSITVSGFDTKSQVDSIHRISGYMPQKFGLYEDLTVIENLELYAELRNLHGKEKKEKFQSLLEFAGLQDFQSRIAGNLSGGMKQKLGLACALIGDPQILLLDEPTVGVDPLSRRVLRQMVKALLKKGISVVWSTSYLDEAERCDTVILLNEGKKLYEGTPSAFLAGVEDQTWQIKGIDQKERRRFLMHMLKNDAVIDGVIQGNRIRIVLGKGKKHPPLEKGEWMTVKPWFEDAFIDILGGTQHDHSALAQNFPEKPLDKNCIIDARGLTKKFGEFIAVNNNNFQIKRGEIFGLLGPNGAGKSTTFKMMCGLLQPTDGKALVKGLDLKTATSQARAHIGYMAQKFSLYGNLSVLQNLRFFSGLYGVSGAFQKHQIDLMIEIFSFKSYLNMNAASLPLGFKQRLSLACSVMHQPDVLFLDEPTSGVDPLTRREFWTHINGMVEKGVTVMVTTHFMDEAEYCDRIGLIYRGENIATGTPDQLKESVVSSNLKEPTLEDAFVYLIQQHDNVIEKEKRRQ